MVEEIKIPLSPVRKFTKKCKEDEKQIKSMLQERLFYRHRDLVNSKCGTSSRQEIMTEEWKMFFPIAGAPSVFSPKNIKAAAKRANKRREKLFKKEVDKFFILMEDAICY